MATSSLAFPGAFAALSVLLSSAAGAQESESVFDAPQVVVDPTYRETLGDAGRFTNTGDFDGDGRADLIGEWGYRYGDVRHVIKIWYGDGAGGVRARWQEVLEDTTSLTADDGHVGVGTLGVPTAFDDFVYAYNVSDGAQTHGDLFIYSGSPSAPVLRASLSVEEAIHDVEIGDFDGDGKGDFVALLRDAVDADSLRFSLHSPAGWGSSIRDVALPPGSWTQIDPGELTGDGVTDVVATGSDSVAIRTAARRKVRRAVVEPWKLPHGLVEPDAAVGDVDGDGRDDVVLFSTDGYRVLSSGAPGFGPLRAGGPATELADVDGDGDLDGICCGGGGGPSGPTYNTQGESLFEIALGDGAGGFAPSFQLPAVASEHIAGALDFDGDGDLDLAAGRVIYFNPGKIEPRTDFPSPAPELEAAGIGDVDGDGDPDFELTLASCLVNQGDGTTQVAVPSVPLPPPGHHYVGPGFPGDFDGDGSADLLVELWTDADLYVGFHLLANAGGGSFVDAGVAAFPLEPFSARTTLDARSSVVADLDGDGDQDLVVRRSLEGAPNWNDMFTSVWLNEGSGTFVEGDSWAKERLVDIGDLDGDGILDAVTVRLWKLYWHQGLGDGSFSFRLLIRYTTGGVYFDLVEEPCAVFDGEFGKDSVLAVRNEYRVRRYSKPDTEWLELASPVSGSSSPEHERIFLRSADFDHDGVEDVLAWPTAGLGADIEFGTETGLDREGPILLFEPRAFVDVDGDGDDDAITASGIVHNRTIEGPAAGGRWQYGLGTAGAGGVVPTLGAVGPFVAGGSVEFRISGGVGGAQVEFAISRAAAEIADWPVPGVTALVDPDHPYFQTVSVTLDGEPGVAGVGSATVPFSVPRTFAGVSEYFQAWITDPAAPAGVSASNGLRIDFGG